MDGVVRVEATLALVEQGGLAIDAVTRGSGFGDAERIGTPSCAARASRRG
jgi:hypothetical protein